MLHAPLLRTVEVKTALELSPICTVSVSMPARLSVAVPLRRNVQAPLALRRTWRASPGLSATVSAGVTPSMFRLKPAELVLLTASAARTVTGTAPLGMLGISTGKAHNPVPVAALKVPPLTLTSTWAM